ncbi:plasmid recombination protein [Croceicoccus hydrothermalis]|uniref:plasmid recombination protein n=1 Tax=Croceicoccus hydrothermalis TaxID=2867964 RepID=UPI001EFADE38|nr:plasmid recombination protein [Croceicoccus hydrothermalis]
MSKEKVHCILGQRKLKQADIVHARGHNNREEEVGNSDRSAPPPAVVYGPENAWVGVRDRLKELGIQPRKNAVLALELMMTTSPEYWPGEDPACYVRKLRQFILRSMRYLLGRYPRCAIVSITLHLDEQTPHLHVIVLPVRKRVDARFSDKRERWMLSARGDLPPKREKGAPPIDYANFWRGGIGSRGQMAYEQTVFAKVMTPLGLERGRVWSGAPNKPNAEYQAEMRDAIAAANVEREAGERVREQLEGDRAEIVDMRAEIERQRAELEASLTRVREEEARLAEQRRALLTERAEFEQRLEKARAWKAKLDANRDRVKTEHDRLVKQAPLVADLAEASIKAIRSIDLDFVSPRERDTVMRAAYAIGLTRRIHRTGPKGLAGVA